MVSNAKIRGDWVKKNKIFLLIVSGVILAGLLVYLNRGILLDHFWSKVESQLDYERFLEEGDDFNKISWGDLSFQINHHKSGNNLEYVSVADKESYILLKNISSYKIVEEKLYVRSKDGYAIVDENNICKIFVDQSILKTTGEYTQDEYGNKIYSNQKVDKENIKYLSSYDDFSTQERDIFKKMLK